jgi:hypothetical protein
MLSKYLNTTFWLLVIFYSNVTLAQTSSLSGSHCDDERDCGGSGCISGKCVVPGSVKVGRRCGSSVDCSGSLICSSKNFCASEDVDAETECTSDDNCIGSRVCLDKKCIVRSLDGGYCDRDSNCKSASSTCIAHRCMHIASDIKAIKSITRSNSSCTSDASCPGAQVCFRGECTVQLTNGSSCDRDVECFGGDALCRANICTVVQEQSRDSAQSQQSVVPELMNVLLEGLLETSINKRRKPFVPIPPPQPGIASKPYTPLFVPPPYSPVCGAGGVLINGVCTSTNTPSISPAAGRPPDVNVGGYGW